jgi:hypothetical protein
VYVSPNIIRAIKLRGTGWTAHVARMGKMKTGINIWLKTSKEKDHSKDPAANRRIISEWILGKRWERVDWMHLAQDRDQWWAHVNTVMNFQIP